MNIAQLDKNFAVRELDRDDVVFYDARKAPFRIYGLYEPQTTPFFCRMPASVAETVSVGVGALSKNTSGGRVRFKTDSPFIAIRADMPSLQPTDNMSMLGNSFSIYINQNGKSTFFSPFRYQIDKLLSGEGILSIAPFSDGRMRDITIYFPMYASVNSLYIGVKEGSALLPGDTYAHEKPVVFYGSSITQGGCASHAGNNYTDILSRRFDFNYINLGFSGCARAEDAIADYIKGLDMSMFVYDYDHNAPNFEQLEKTHEKMFCTIREANPDLPIIMMSAPDFDRSPESNACRRNLIFANYTRAHDAGDNNVYFVDGEHMFGDDGRDGCTVDGCHPNDLGFYRMADAVSTVIKSILLKGDF